MAVYGKSNALHKGDVNDVVVGDFECFSCHRCQTFLLTEMSNAVIVIDVKCCSHQRCELIKLLEMSNDVVISDIKP